MRWGCNVRVVRLQVKNFRGFEELQVRPRSHVVLMGPPGGGRSDLIEALSRVLEPEASRAPVTEGDFHWGRVGQPVEVEVVVGDLGNELEQRFLDRLEVWDDGEGSLVEESESAGEIDKEGCSFVLRVCYMGEWDVGEQRGAGWVYYPKSSDAEAEAFDYVRQPDIEALGYVRMRWGQGRPLDLGVRSVFRKVLESAEGGDFADAVNRYLEGVETAAGGFTRASQVRRALEEVMEPLRVLFGLQEEEVSDLVRFTPEGGAVSGLLRSVAPSLSLPGEPSWLPVNRCGSTVRTLFGLAETLALARASAGIVAIDDLGDGLDSASALHMSSALMGVANQVWITTRLPSVAETFDMSDVVRLGRIPGGGRLAYQAEVPSSKAERIAARHWGRNVLPCLSYDGVVVVEGPHDLAALHGLALRMLKDSGVALPNSLGVAMISCDAGGGGGSPSVPRLTGLAREMGLWTVGVIDWDKAANADAVLQSALAGSDTVVRFPEGVAIERALVEGIPEDVLREVLEQTIRTGGIQGVADLGGLQEDGLKEVAVEVLKRGGGLHGLFVEALPPKVIPPLARAVLERSVSAVVEQTRGLIQL